MRIEEITDKNLWENFLAECQEKTFFQSWNWGEFHGKMGEKIWRFGIYEDDIVSAVATIVKVRAKRGTFFAIEHGPVARSEEREVRGKIVHVLLGKLKTLAKEERTQFIRISPVWERNEGNERIFQDLEFRKAPTYAAAESSWKLDIAKSEEELLGSMRKTTRYLIRQTSKNEEIEITTSDTIKDIDTFAKLSKEVGQRQEFTPFSFQYAKSEFEVLSKDNNVLLFFGKYRGEVVAAAIVVFWSGIGFYHQAASLQQHAKLSISYLLQWEAIKEAKRRGCKLYDFWGFIDPKKYPKHPWAGPTLFKMGFGGKPYEYVKTQDYVLSWKYWPTAIFETIRTKRRHL